MGTWDVGPFDNDTAADFARDLDEVAAEEREPMIRSVLKRVADPADYSDAPDAERAVGAAALVVAQHPHGEPAPNGAKTSPASATTLPLRSRRKRKPSSRSNR
ncbi:DUF4259 domain-containing protein [Streptomyces sp. NPDC006261]|uniref:DUF4259 domain-containing protein n=1 Tax=Streptomyces sp. NPDC006261 TaxID=3156739 RepID=UPI0033A23F35